MKKRTYPVGYGELHPEANYRPWTTDEDFARIYRAVADHSMVDQYRCYSLYQLLDQALALPGDILEVGVWRGGTGALLAQTAALRAPDRKRIPTVWLADTFRGVVKAGERDPYYKGGEHADTAEDTVRALLQATNVRNCNILPGVFPDETGAAIAAQQFCFCHIDVDVYQSAKDIVEWVWPRLSIGGIIVFDDYGFYGCEGVAAFVNEQKVLPDRTFVYNLNGHGIFIKRS